MAGRLVRDGADLCFVPRFAFLDGTAYTVAVDGTTAAVLARARPGRPATTEVAGIRPTAAEVPVNLLRLYVWFSAPMSEGCAAEQVRLARDDGSVLAGALLPAEHELWDAARRRLTVLLDPARIKRGLAGHQEAGYPLRSGEPFRLIVDSGFLRRAGTPPPGARAAAVPGRRRRAPPRRSRPLGADGPARRNVRAAAGRLRPPARSRPARPVPARDRTRRPARRRHRADRPRGAVMAAGAPAGLGLR